MRLTDVSPVSNPPSASRLSIAAPFADFNWHAVVVDGLACHERAKISLGRSCFLRERCARHHKPVVLGDVALVMGVIQGTNTTIKYKPNSQERRPVVTCFCWPMWLQVIDCLSFHLSASSLSVCLSPSPYGCVFQSIDLLIYLSINRFI